MFNARPKLFRPGVAPSFWVIREPALGPTQPPVQWLPGLLPGVKWPGRGVDSPPPPSGDGKEESYTPAPPLGLLGLFYVELLCVPLLLIL
jgi:hypothetical protein